MATKKSQRIGIWIVAILMLVSTIALFATLVLARINEPVAQEREQERLLREHEKELEEQQAREKEAMANNRPFGEYEAEAFDSKDVTELEVEILKQGEGEKLTKTDTIKASYFGWTSDGGIFDSTNQADSDNTPAEFPLDQVIQGWTEGLSGVRVGSVVRLSIPAEKAYGEAGNPPVIGPNEPLKFIVRVEEKV